MRSTLGTRDFSSAVSVSGESSRLRPIAEDVSAFGQHRKFSPHARTEPLVPRVGEISSNLKMSQRSRRDKRDLTEIKEMSAR